MSAPEPKAVPAPVERMQTRVPVESRIPILDSAMFDHMTRVAKVMAAAKLVPEHLTDGDEKTAVSNCLLVVNQAIRWQMDPFAVAQCTFVHAGKIGYEGKLIASVVNSHPMVVKRLSYTYTGEGPNRKVKVTGRIAGDDVDREIEGTFAAWHTRDKSGNVNASWNKGPDQMLAYRGAREWARRWLPEAILGVWSDDEIFEIAPNRAAPEPAASPAATRSGADRLNAALGGAAPATDVTASTDGAAGGQAVQTLKPIAGLDDRNRYVERMKGCADSEVLNLTRDEARLNFEWTDPDAKVLDETYRERLQQLEPKA